MRLNVDIDDDVYKKLKAKCLESEISISDWIREKIFLEVGETKAYEWNSRDVAKEIAEKLVVDDGTYVAKEVCPLELCQRDLVDGKCPVHGRM